MNIHPFIVHFPVAFLPVYALMELFRLRYFTSAPYWFYIKAMLVIVGSLGAGAAYLSGEQAAVLLGASDLIEVHAQWAKTTVIIFGAISFIYASAWLSRSDIIKSIERDLGLGENRFYVYFLKFINYSLGFPAVLAALIGLLSIVITGALGGAIVYGPDIDPAVRIIYDLMM